MKINFDYAYVLVFLYGVIFIPGLLMTTGVAFGSNFLGVVMICLVVLVIKIFLDPHNVKVTKSFIVFSILFSFLISVHLMLTWFFFDNVNGEGYVKSIFSSLSLIFIILFSCYFVAESVRNVDTTGFDKIISNIFFVLLALGLIVSACTFGGLDSSKQMLFFTEPSHYALIVSIFFCYKLSFRLSNILYAIPLLVVALVVQNLTLIFGVALAIFVNLFRLKTFFLIPLILSLTYFSVVGLVGNDKLNYYYDRIQISEKSANTSTLTLLSGYEQAWLALENSYGLGYGLQRMGYGNDRGEIVEIIGSYRAGNTDSNLYDGGLFISKLVVEFGIFGIVFFIFSSLLGYKNFKRTDCKKERFFSSVLIMSCMYFLLRGSGYFTPSAILIFLALIYFTSACRGRKEEVVIYSGL